MAAAAVGRLGMAGRAGSSGVEERRRGQSWAGGAPLAICAAAALLGPLPSAVKAASRQQPASPARVIDGSDRVVLKHNVHRLALPQFDKGRSDPNLPMDRMILALAPRRGARQELDQFLTRQLDPRSSDYHRWLTPEEFGERFGATDEDVQLATTWLEEQGFHIDEVARGRGWINFSGTASQVEAAFTTEMHDYLVDGKVYHANAVDPSIPRALSSIIEGVVSLNSFPKRNPQSTPFRPAPSQVSTPELASASEHFVGPADFAKIHGVDTVYGSGIDGTGRTIAIVGRTDIKLSDVRSFRRQFGLPAKDPVFIHNGPAPGNLGGGEEVEANLDVQWSGAVAKGATIQFVISKTTNATDGVDLSAQYVVDRNAGDVISTSFSQCEAAMSSTELAFYSGLWGQAAAQGITSFVSSGNSGAAGCDLGSDPIGSGRAVSGLCSTPNNVCVGGSQFDDTGSPGSFWSSSNDPTRQASALSYIPEIAWNESGSVAGGSGLWSSGGGPSAVYSKPSWQSAPGVPADGRRDVPDVSLAAASRDGYLIWVGGLGTVGGTSASSPSFAGLAALIAQKTGQRLGNANSVFYTLATDQYGGGGAAVFHDVTVGDNSVPGVSGFASGFAYDQVTGLGSVDASALVASFTSLSTPSVSISDVSALEGNSGAKSFTFAVSLSAASGATTLVPYSTADGSATATSDYVAAAGTLTIPAGAPSGKINVAVKGDAAIEPDETFFVNLGTPTNATIAKGQGTGTILNDDSPVFEFGAASFKVPEAAAFATIAVKRTEGLPLQASVSYATSDGTAASSSNRDYTPTSGTLTFNPGVSVLTFKVPITHDTIHELNETVLLSLSNPQPAAQNAALGAQKTAVLTILDNDTGGKVQFLPAAHTVNAAAAATAVKLTVKRIGGLASGVTVHCTMVDGTATGGVDYDNTPRDLTFLSSGVGATTQTLTIPIFQDTTGAKNFTVTLSPPTGGAVLGTPAVATVTILGTEPTLGFGSGTYSVKTTQPTAMVTVKRSPPLTGTVTVAYSATGGTAAGGGVDYALNPGTLTFGPNVSSRTFAVSIVKDPLVDPPETVDLALGSPTWSLGSAVLDPVLGTSVLTITDPNVTPTVGFAAATFTVNEATPQALVTVRRKGDLVGTVTVDYAATGGTATNGGPNPDYTPNAGTLTFLPNQVMRTFPISIVNDGLIEGTETVQLQLTNPTWTVGNTVAGTAVVGPIGTATLNIIDNEPTVQFAAAQYNAREGASTLLVAVRRTGALTGTATVTYDVTGGTAVRDTGTGGDYSLTVPGSLTFAPGQAMKTIPITLEPDKLADGTKTIDLALSSPSGAGLGTPSTTTVFIKDNPPPPPTPPGLIDTVYLIMLENTDWSSATNPTQYIKGNPILPYLNSLIQSYAAADDFHAPYHPSMPNYLALETGGDNLGRTSSPMPFKYTANVAITDGCFEPFPGAPTDGSVNCRNGLFRVPLGTPHLSKSINLAGYTWKQYNGDPPGLGSICPNVNRHIDDYSADHSPNLYFDDVTGSDPLLLTLQPGSPLLAYCRAHLRPLAELVGDLQSARESNYNFIIPTDQDQGEKCPCGPGGRLGNADTFMQQLIPEIMNNSPAWARGSAVIFIAWDEPDNSNNTDPSGLIVISPHVKKGYLSQTKFPNGEASLVKTILEIFGLPLFGKTADPANPDLSEFFTIFP